MTVRRVSALVHPNKDRRSTMKKVIMLAGVAALLASPALPPVVSPALAQAPSGSYGSGNIIFPGNPAAAAAAGAYSGPAAAVGGGAFAHEPATAPSDSNRMTRAPTPIGATTDAGTSAADRLPGPTTAMNGVLRARCSLLIQVNAAIARVITWRPAAATPA